MHQLCLPDAQGMPRDPSPGAPCCYTIGYRILRDTIQLQTLATALDATVVDVRYMPFTKAPFWNKKTLRKVLGDRYTWIEAFGNRAYRSAGEIVIDDWPLGLAKITPLIARGSVLLLCTCATAIDCHRRVLAEQLHVALGVPVRHLTTVDVTRLTRGGESRA